MESNNNGGSKFLNGFLLGALIGGGLVLFLSSKKGKKLLDLISQEGLDNIEDLLEEQGQVPVAKEDKVKQDKKEPNGEVRHAKTINQNH